MAAAPESDSGPPHPRLLVLVVVPVSVTHFRSMTSFSCIASGPSARTVAFRRRALD